MADTQRSISTLLTSLFQDGQAAGSINPQDIRDLIVSIGAPSAGSCGMSGNTTETVISATSTFVKVLGTTTEENSTSDVTVESNKLTYTGLNPINFGCSAIISMTSPSSSQIVAFQFAKNGTLIGTPIHRKIGTGSDVGAMSIGVQISLSQNDYIEVYCANDTSTANVLAEDFHMSGSGQVI